MKQTNNDYTKRLIKNKKLAEIEMNKWNKKGINNENTNFSINNNKLYIKFKASEIILITQENKLNKLCKYIIKYLDKNSNNYSLVSIKTDSKINCLYKISIYIKYINEFINEDNLKKIMKTYDNYIENIFIDLQTYINNPNNETLSFLYK